jgi:hypothetical protein
MTERPLEPPALTCLERTRSAVLNVLTVVGIAIALSGILIRWRDGWALERAPERIGRSLIGGLFSVLASSVVIRRVGAGRSALQPPTTRASRCFRAHLASALVGALAVPLGLAHGWFIRPRLDAVLPFWVAALALGVLAFPRAATLEGFDEPMPPSQPSKPPETGPTS